MRARLVARIGLFTSFSLLVACGGGNGSEDPTLDSGDEASASDTAVVAEADLDSSAVDSEPIDMGEGDGTVVDSTVDEAAVDATDATLEVADEVGTEAAVDSAADSGPIGPTDTGFDSGFPVGCTDCHGDKATGYPAPPRAVSGATATTAHGVGAHRKHLDPSTWRHDVTCADCHVVPTAWDHMNGTVDYAFSKLAGASTSYDKATYTCTGAYCHGSTLMPAPTGGTVARQPVWNVVDGTYSKCGSTCHTNPPGGTHPAVDNCATCHGEVISSYDPVAKTAVWKDASRHVDGKLDLLGSGMSCTTCHGDIPSGNPAPPRGTKGELLTTEHAVGAHQAHLKTSTWRRDVACQDCHLVPTTTTHANSKVDFAFSAIASTGSATPLYDSTTYTCTSVYCHGTTLKPALTGGTTARDPLFNKVDGTFNACGASCHTNPPGGTHPNNTGCPTCHAAVITAYDPTTKAATWKDRTLHVDGIVETTGLSCTSCHGDAAKGDPAPPLSTKGETATTAQTVGAHQAHLAAGSTWHKDLACVDCHTVPTSTSHFDGKTDFAWGALATARTSVPTYDFASAKCSNVYCHGNGLMAAVSGGTIARQPVWNKVDGTFDACGSTCHTNPPGGTHPAATDCATCHGPVITSYDPTTKTAVWKDRTLHVNGIVEKSSLVCTSCHGDPAVNEAPPKGTKGETATTQKAVGAHQTHLATSTWHKDVVCTDCHTKPTSNSHSNGVTDFNWSALASADVAAPAYSGATATCSGVYCHGATLLPAVSGGTTKRSPIWTQVDGSFDACGGSCHTNPPGGTHPASTACETCHSPVITSYNATAKTAVWKDRTLHINGVVDRADLTCTTCHGNSLTSDPSPPKGTKGETLTTQKAVGAHQVHLGTSTWRKDLACNDCHTVPISTLHSNAVTDFTWSALSSAGGATPTYTSSTVTCAGVYCHGVTLATAASGGSVKRSPLWTTVDGTYDACGSSCHTNPPGGTHVAHTDCSICHTSVISSYDPISKVATWADRTKHVNGVRESNKYHDLSGWTSPGGGANHHGSKYFLTNAQKDEHGKLCTQCHGADYNGGTVGVSCNNASCHKGTDWKGCSFCHGTPPSQFAPPLGVGGETLTNTLAVGRHTAHLTSSSTHAAFSCATCHSVPATGDVAHALGYVPSASLETAGHHGDLTFTAGATGMTWNVAATVGGPVTARGTCLGACHSNGRGGAPVVTPYWAGGSWTKGSCGTCHLAAPTSGQHSRGEHQLGCATCHPSATASTHMNGTRDVNSPISSGGRSMTPSRTGPCGTTRVTCTGTCHGTECW